jgi:uncharacterized repeat protein (TIGR03803 family)
MKRIAIALLFAAAVRALPAQTLTVVHSFEGPDGFAPRAPLVQASDGDLYGTTQFGGANCGSEPCGTVFKITPNGALTTLYTFCTEIGCKDGSEPLAGLIQTTSGSFFGTTINGGAHDNGAVFEISTGGALTRLHSFDLTDGANPSAGLVQAAGGDFYGTTGYGGANESGDIGGTVFKIARSGTLTTIYNFCSASSCTDGYEPVAGLIQAANGNFYGTTKYGGQGADCLSGDCGTVFDITPDGALTTLYSFCSAGRPCKDGTAPNGLIQAANGGFYGTTSGGGATACNTGSGCGTVFKITPGGALTTLYSFCLRSACADGTTPFAGLVQGTDGNFYGTTSGGGSKGHGTVFKITPSGALTTLYSFCSLGGSSCTDGEYPDAGLVQDTSGSFYGTTERGGTGSGCTRGCGTIFSLSVGLGPFVTTIPRAGKPGEAVDILGTDLTGATGVAFNGTAAAFTVVSPSLITATVPAGATDGKVTVATSGGTLLSNVPFAVLP